MNVKRVPRVAVVATVYFYSSHSDVILGRLMGNFRYRPEVEVVSIYMEQFPTNDLCRAEAARCGIPLYATIGEAIRAPEADGPIDGVLIIGEHGDYPRNEKDQKMYPRKRLLEETLLALDELGLRVPIFSDKHLSYSLEEATWMYEQLKARQLPFFGGSSIPHTDLVPPLEPERLHGLKEIVAISFSPAIECYGFHGLDLMQSYAEKRHGGETGVQSVYAVKGPEVWAMADRGEWPEELMVEALRMFSHVNLHNVRQVEPDPVLFVIVYNDGTRGYVIQFFHLVDQWAFAFRDGAGQIAAARCDNERGRPYTHFERLTQMIERFIITGQEPFPMERTYLTTGMTAYCMESLYQGRRLDSPELNIRYNNG